MGRLLFQKIEFPPDSSWALGEKFLLCFTAFGNLELWNRLTEELVWETGTQAEKMAMQGDGNLVIYAAGEEPVWSSATHGNPDAFLCVQDDGKLAVLSADLSRELWSRQQQTATSPSPGTTELDRAPASREPDTTALASDRLSADEYRNQLASLEPAVRTRR